MLARSARTVVPKMARRARSKPGSSTIVFPSKAGIRRCCINAVIAGSARHQAQLPVTVTLVDRHHHASLPIVLSAVSAAGVDRRCGPSRKAHVPAAIRFQDQAADCAGADPRGSEGGRCSRRGADGGELRHNSKLRPGPHWMGSATSAAIIPTVKVRPVREDDPKPPRVSVESLALSLPESRLAHRHLAGRTPT